VERRIAPVVMALVLGSSAAARAGGAFLGVEAGVHRITPLAPALGEIMAGDRTAAAYALQAGYEGGAGGFVALEARRLTLHPAFFRPRAQFLSPYPSVVHLTPLMGVLGVRPWIGRQARLAFSGGAGALLTTHQLDGDQGLWTGRHNWSAVGRVGMGVDYQPGSVAVGLLVSWLFVPSIRIPQAQEADFGGLSVAATLALHGRR